MDIVQKYCLEKEITTVISIHDINLALRYATNYIFLKDQKIYAKGSREILDPTLFQEVYSVEVDLYQMDGNTFVIPKKQTGQERKVKNEQENR